MHLPLADVDRFTGIRVWRLDADTATRIETPMYWDDTSVRTLRMFFGVYPDQLSNREFGSLRPPNVPGERQRRRVWHQPVGRSGWSRSCHRLRHLGFWSIVNGIYSDVPEMPISPNHSPQCYRRPSDVDSDGDGLPDGAKPSAQLS